MMPAPMTEAILTRMKKRVALVYGGDSSEWEISVLSGKNVASALDPAKYEVYEILLRGEEWSLCDSSVTDRAVPVSPVDKADFSVTAGGRKVTFDLALIMIHGTPGENGVLQAYFENLGLKFTTCSSEVASLTFRKHACKRALEGVGVRMAGDVVIKSTERWNSAEIVEKLGLPLFVKPDDGGSSFGITKVKSAAYLDSAIELAFKESETVIVEEFVQGRELTEGVFFSGGEVVTLPITEIISENEYFDYEAKYLGKSREVCPAPLTPEQEAQVRACTSSIYRHFGCRGLIRVDYIMNQEGLFFLEINPVPGMTKMSLVPVQIRTAGYALSEVLDSIIAEL